MGMITRMLRLVLISFVILFVLASLVGALLPSKVLVSRAIDIGANKDSIKPYLTDIEKWREWLEGMNSASVKIYSPAKADIGNTQVTITNISDSTVVTNWVGAKGSAQISTMRLIGDKNKNLTVVQWQFEQNLKWYPWEKLGSMMNDKILGTMMEKNLNNLRSLMDKK